MNRGLILLLVATSAPALGGCVAGMVASAAGMALEGAQGHPRSNVDMQPTAKEACTGRAAQLGAVHIIDVQQQSVDKIVVWGTVDDTHGRQSFECGFKTAITYFKVRDIGARR